MGCSPWGHKEFGTTERLTHTQMGGVEGRSKEEGIYVYTQLIQFVVQQKLTQHCKATIAQLKKIL